jgi:hypothetical protein
VGHAAYFAIPVPAFSLPYAQVVTPGERCLRLLVPMALGTWYWHLSSLPGTNYGEFSGTFLSSPFFFQSANFA